MALCHENIKSLRRLFGSHAHDAGKARLYPLYRCGGASGRHEAQRHLHDQAPARERPYHDGSRRTHHPVAIGVDQKTAEQDACRIEHDISQQTYDAMCAHAQREADQGVAGFDAMNEK